MHVFSTADYNAHNTDGVAGLSHEEMTNLVKDKFGETVSWSKLPKGIALNKEDFHQEGYKTPYRIDDKGRTLYTFIEKDRVLSASDYAKKLINWYDNTFSGEWYISDEAEFNKIISNS